MQLLFPMPHHSQGILASGASSGLTLVMSNCGEEVQPMSDVCWACGKNERQRTGAKQRRRLRPLLRRPRLPPSIRSGAGGAALLLPLLGRRLFTSARWPILMAAVTRPAERAIRSARKSRRGSVDAREQAATSPMLRGESDLRGSRQSKGPTLGDPWLIGLWVLIGVSICVIAWLAVGESRLK